MPGRTLAIGDIHGCSVALKTLIDAVDPRPDDTIVALGDVIDYGPDSKAVIEHLIDLSRRCRLVLIEGNHESMLFHAPGGRDDYTYWTLCGGDATVACYPGRPLTEPIEPTHFQFLRSRCRDYWETDSHIFVHASYFPNRPMAEQDAHTLRWESAVPDRMAAHFSGKTVVAGHTPQTNGNVLDLGYLKLIDTDASRGGWLTALEVGCGWLIQADQKARIRKPSLGSRL